MNEVRVGQGRPTKPGWRASWFWVVVVIFWTFWAGVLAYSWGFRGWSSALLVMPLVLLLIHWMRGRRTLLPGG